MAVATIGRPGGHVFEECIGEAFGAGGEDGHVELGEEGGNVFDRAEELHLLCHAASLGESAVNAGSPSPAMGNSTFGNSAATNAASPDENVDPLDRPQVRHHPHPLQLAVHLGLVRRDMRETAQIDAVGDDIPHARAGHLPVRSPTRGRPRNWRSWRGRTVGKAA